MPVLGLLVVEPGRNAPPGRLVWDVSSLLLAVADTIAARFGACAVRGEISGYTRAASGHCYFNLKDAGHGGATLRCAMFRRAASLLAFAPSEGMLVDLRGRVGVYEPRGELQFVVESMQRSGAGALYEEFLRLRERLAAEGLFDPALKRPLPAYPRRIGLVTSLGAAALHDVITALMRRAPHVEIVVYPSAVQGVEAPAALCRAIALAGARAEVEALLVCRGGGSLEDLWAYNDERVVRAISAAPMPVVSGVGHETDLTLADLAADLRAPTPTAAAELVAPPTQACLDALDTRARQLQRRVGEHLDRQAQRLDRIALLLARPAEGARRHARRLEGLAQRLRVAGRRGVEQREAQAEGLAQRLSRAPGRVFVQRAQHLEGMAARLRALDPQRVLQRGYCWLTDAAGAAVVSIDRIEVGDALHAVLADGAAEVAVTAVDGASGETRERV